MPTAYGDNSRISPMNDFRSKVLIFFAKFLQKKIPALLILGIITHIRLIAYPKVLRYLQIPIHTVKKIIISNKSQRTILSRVREFLFENGGIPFL